jgi:hypothetical protein
MDVGCVNGLELLEAPEVDLNLGAALFPFENQASKLIFPCQPDLPPKKWTGLSCF